MSKYLLVVFWFFASMAHAQTPVKFQLDWRFEGPAALFLQSEAKGYYKAAGLNVSIDAGTGSAAAKLNFQVVIPRVLFLAVGTVNYAYKLAAAVALIPLIYLMRRGIDFESRVYEGADHNEAAWRARIGDALRFLLPDRDGPTRPRRGPAGSTRRGSTRSRASFAPGTT